MSSRCVRFFGLSTVALLLLQVLLNLALDPTARFHGGSLLLNDVKTLQMNQKLPYFERFVSSHKGEPVRIVLGSSRVMMLVPSNQTSELDFFNLGIAGAKAEDLLAITRYLLSRSDLRIDSVVIGIDPLMLIPAGKSYGERFRGVPELEGLMTDRLSTSLVVNQEFLALVSDDWLTAIQDMRQTIPQLPIDANGVLSSRDYARRLGTTPEEQAAYFASNLKFLLSAVPKSAISDLRRTEDLRETVQLFSDAGIPVTLFIPPKHPSLQQALKDNPYFQAHLALIRQIMADLDQSESVAFVDLNDPSILGLTGDDFWDNHHYKAEAGVKVAAAIEQASISAFGPVRSSVSSQSEGK